MQKFYKIVTYGCQMNIHESEKLAGILMRRGYAPTEKDEEADVIVFNTCCIRENAEQHAFGNIGALKQLKKKKPSLIIAVGGCMTQQEKEASELKKKMPYVDIIFGTHNLEKFGELLDKRIAGGKKIVEIVDGETGKIIEGEKPFRTSYPNAWVNIMQGCNNFCTYCIVPYVRGRERSRDMVAIYSEVNVLVKSGYKEITLLGQNVNSYGKDIEGASFAALINMLKTIDGDYRLRFMTNHPKDLTEEVVKAVAENPHCCHQIHLPVQAGSNRVLKLMNRRYTREDYFKKVELIRNYMPDCAISTDIMIGFPTETEEDFLDTLDLSKKVGFSSAFTFVYSRRKGTPADRMEEQIPEEVKKERIMRLVEFQNAETKRLSSSYEGKTVRILCEDFDEKKGLYLGRDEYGRMGYFNSDVNLIGDFVNVKIEKANGISLFGKIVD